MILLSLSKRNSINKVQVWLTFDFKQYRYSSMPGHKLYCDGHDLSC
ncbi:hypothetical Protein YC6258_05342 [Gynuella sunshinyii YC6258]|uniref:Uncharacterized protein n=1 Tax=Gynuella sunshinyii YC6258 TaxID=1445510 RepID=A0A0C5VRV8_9GAMM|nr:hypothetical Protein YC6258_05342 [Gynuella sunshinyii YC6258]